jgi:hypothetical protein
MEKQPFYVQSSLQLKNARRDSGIEIASVAHRDGRTDGADMRLPDLREKIARCERRGQCTMSAWFVTSYGASLPPNPAAMLSG